MAAKKSKESLSLKRRRKDAKRRSKWVEARRVRLDKVT